MTDKTIIEINGIKMEVDLRTAKTVRVDTLAVGTKVRILKKQYDGHAVHSGVVIGFENFQKLPTIMLAYLDSGYGESPLKFLSLNAESKDIEVIVADQDETEDFSRSVISNSLARNIETKRIELEKAESAMALFTKYYGKVFEPETEEA